MQTPDGFDWKGIRDRLFDKGRENRQPVAALFELPPLCNFRCKMCYVRQDPASQKLQKPLLTAEERIRDAFYSCRNCGSYFVVTWRGYMLGCMTVDSIREPIGDEDILLTHRRLWDRLCRLRLPEKCRTCDLIDVCVPCPGKLEGESGDPEQTAPYVCAMANWLYDQYTGGGKPETDCD